MDRISILAARSVAGEYTPLKRDCGLLCGAACCQRDDDGRGGVALLPGEEELLRDISWGHTGWDEAMGAPMLVCDGPCLREERPFLCRIFPLCPRPGRDGRWTVRMDARARPMCPLSRCGLRGLDPAFVRGAILAVRQLCEDPGCAAFFSRWAEIEEKFRQPFL